MLSDFERCLVYKDYSSLGAGTPEEKQKALDKEAAKLKETETAYGALKAQYRDTANQAKELGAQVIALETAIADGITCYWLLYIPAVLSS